MSEPDHIEVSTGATSEPAWLELVRQPVGSLRYGLVQIVMHDGRVMQFEKTERVRLEPPRPDSH